MKKIVLDCERMKYPHTGLYHYCLQLGLALKKQLHTEEELLAFYVRGNHGKMFGENETYINHSSLDKFTMPTGNTDIWHTTYQSTNYFPSRKKLKIVLTVHDLNILHENKLNGRRLDKEVAKIQNHINRADHIVAISEFTSGDIRKYLVTGNTPVTVIHNGCNFEQITEPAAPKINVKGDFLFTLGTINAKKNFHVLPCLLENNQRTLVIAGVTDDENYKAKILSEAKKYNAGDRVIFAGPVSENDKQWYMRHCEAFVFPSLAEGFGLPVIEAMYFGKPVVIAALTALPEIGGDAAFYFSDFEPASMKATLAAALATYHADHSLKQKIKARAALFTWPEAAKKYMEVYRSLY